MSSIHFRKLGIVDLDSSHPQAWLPILRSMGFDITSVFDGGSVRNKEYPYTFANKYGIPLIFQSLEEMAISENVEMVMIHSCNWDLHVSRALPFINLRKPIFIDKPIAGNVRDLATLASWVTSGCRITGGSALRYCREVSEEHSFSTEHGPIRSAMIGCGIDDFYYGIHAYALACGLMGRELLAVRHLDRRLGRHQIDMQWSEDRFVSLVVGTTNWLPFFATVIYSDLVRHIQVNTADLYHTLLAVTLPFLSGLEPHPPIPFTDLIIPEQAALAARLSFLQEGRWVSLQEIDMCDVGYDGDAFARAYQIKLSAGLNK
jgi:hypothetical protein